MNITSVAAHRLMRRAFRGIAVIALLAAALARPSTGRAQQDYPGIDGDTYTSPTYGYSLSWDSDLYVPTDGSVTNDHDFLELQSDHATLWFEGYRNTWQPSSGFRIAGAAQACVEQTVDQFGAQLGTPTWLDGAPAPTADGSPPFRREAVGSAFTFTATDGTPGTDVYYIECRVLAGGGTMLLLVLTAPNRAFPSEAAAAAAVFASVQDGDGSANTSTTDGGAVEDGNTADSQGDPTNTDQPATTQGNDAPPFASGTYLCYYYAENSAYDMMTPTFWAKIDFSTDGTYVFVSTGSRGSFSYDGASRTLTFTDGPFAGTYTGVYLPPGSRGTNYEQIVLKDFNDPTDPVTTDYGAYQFCHIPA